MRVKNYEISKELGRGAFGVTYLARDLKTGGNVALKAIDVKASEEKNVNVSLIYDEIATLKNLSQCDSAFEYIVCYHDYFEQDFNGKYTIFIVSEYIDGIDFENFMLKNKDIDYGFLWPILLQLVLGLKHIHSKGYAHRDIKPQNIMITNDCRIKYIDFGLSCFEQCKGISGSLLYMPPELFIDNVPQSLSASQSHDIWSLGMVMFNLLNKGLFPYDTYGRDYDQLVDQILAAPIYPSAYDYDDGRANKFVDSLLINNFESRPTINIVLNNLINNVFARVWRQ